MTDKLLPWSIVGAQIQLIVQIWSTLAPTKQDGDGHNAKDEVRWKTGNCD